MPTHQEEIAWAAGFFDGEGTTHCNHIKARPDRRQCARRQVIFHVSQKERLLLDRFRAAIGTGYITVTFRNGAKKNGTLYTLSIYSYASVKMTLQKLWPYLGQPKRRQALQAFVDYLGFYQRADDLPKSSEADWPVTKEVREWQKRGKFLQLVGC